MPLSEHVGGGLYHSEMAIGHKLKTRREELEREDPIRYSVEETARACGMKASTLYGIEREDQKKSTRLPWLCEYLGLNLKWVTDGVGPRLVRQSPQSVPLVGSDQQNAALATGETGDDMAGLMREAMEVGLLLMTLPIYQRQAAITMIRAMASGAPAEVPRDEPEKPALAAPSLHVRK
jgi:hypothetical protein